MKSVEWYHLHRIGTFRGSRREVFLGKGVLKTCSKFTGKQPYRSVISIKLPRNFIEITLRHGCSPVNLLHIFRTLFSKNTSGWLFLNMHINKIKQEYFKNKTLREKCSNREFFLARIFLYSD